MPRLRSGAGQAGAARAVSGAPGPAGRGGRAAVPGGPRDLCADGQDVDRRAATLPLLPWPAAPQRPAQPATAPASPRRACAGRPRRRRAQRTLRTARKRRPRTRRSRGWPTWASRAWTPSRPCSPPPTMRMRRWSCCSARRDALPPRCVDAIAALQSTAEGARAAAQRGVARCRRGGGAAPPASMDAARAGSRRRRRRSDGRQCVRSSRSCCLGRSCARMRLTPMTRR